MKSSKKIEITTFASRERKRKKIFYLCLLLFSPLSGEGQKRSDNRFLLCFPVFLIYGSGGGAFYFRYKPTNERTNEPNNREKKKEIKKDFPRTKIAFSLHFLTAKKQIQIFFVHSYCCVHSATRVVQTVKRSHKCINTLSAPYPFGWNVQLDTAFCRYKVSAFMGLYKNTLIEHMSNRVKSTVYATERGKR